MDYDNLTDDEVTRLNVLQNLEGLASEEIQLEYERNVPIADVPGEMQCQWFDHHYRPDSACFLSAFDTAELATLAEFSAFFNEGKPALPKDPASIQEWLDDPTWRKIMRKAAETLLLIDDPRS